jgi:hypothetical protein
MSSTGWLPLLQQLSVRGMRNPLANATRRGASTTGSTLSQPSTASTTVATTSTTNNSTEEIEEQQTDSTTVKKTIEDWDYEVVNLAMIWH